MAGEQKSSRMNAMQIQRTRIRTMAMLLLLLPVFSINAQNLYRVNFSGTCSMLDASGKEVVLKVNNKSLISEFGARAGVSNFHNLDLVFHQNIGDGDAIEVINKKTGALIVTVFPIAFPESVEATNSKSITEKRFAYVYNIYEPGFSRGSAIIN